MLNQEKILKLELCTLKGNSLMTLTDNYSFPKMLVDNPDRPRNIMMIKGKKLPVYPKGSVINIIAYMKSGDRLSYPSVIDISTETQLNVAVHFDRVTVLEERRRYYKVETSEPCVLLAITRDENEATLETPIPCTIKNINLGGVFLQLSHPLDLNINDLLLINIPNLMGQKMEILLKILRTQTGKEGELLGYGCCFLYLTPNKEALIAKYINKLQIAKRSIER